MPGRSVPPGRGSWQGRGTEAESGSLGSGPDRPVLQRGLGPIPSPV